MIKGLINFLNMGGNGFYIWISYLIPLLLILFLVIILNNKLKKLYKKSKYDHEI